MGVVAKVHAGLWVAGLAAAVAMGHSAGAFEHSPSGVQGPSGDCRTHAQALADRMPKGWVIRCTDGAMPESNLAADASAAVTEETDRTIWVSITKSNHQYDEVMWHELGHAIAFAYFTDAQRKALWREAGVPEGTDADYADDPNEQWARAYATCTEKGVVDERYPKAVSCTFVRDTLADIDRRTGHHYAQDIKA